jgi:hypothetical protein
MHQLTFPVPLLLLLLSTAAVSGENTGKHSVMAGQLVDKIEKTKEETGTRILLEATQPVPLRKTPIAILAKGEQLGTVEPGTTWEAVDTQEQFLVTAGKGYWVKLRRVNGNGGPEEGWAYLGDKSSVLNFRLK